MDAIIYTTNTGSAERYASCWRRKLNFRYTLLQKRRSRSFPKQRSFIWVGSWLVRSRAMLRLQTLSGMCCLRSWHGTDRDANRKCAEKSAIPADIPLFTLQGDFNVKKLHGIYRPMMEIMVKTMSKSLAEKADRTSEEDDMLDMMLHGGERVKEENLSAVLDWYRVQR